MWGVITGDGLAVNSEINFRRGVGVITGDGLVVNSGIHSRPGCGVLSLATVLL